MILLSSLSITFLLTFPFLYCALKKSPFSKSAASKKKSGSGSGSTDTSTNPNATERQENVPPMRTSFRKVIPSFPPTSDPAPPPPPPQAVTPRKLQFPITKSAPKYSPEEVKEPEEVKKPPAPVKKSGTLRAHREKEKEKEREKKMQVSHELAPKDVVKRKTPSKTALMAKKSEYIDQKDEVDAMDQKSLERNRSLALMPTQMDSVNASSLKDTSAKRAREKVKNGEVNEHSDDTFEDAPSLPKKACPSYDQLVIEKGESPKENKKKKDD